MQRETDRTPPDRFITSLWGGPKTAKTYTAFTWPGPWYYHETDEGGFGRVRAHLSDEKWEKGIYRVTYPLSGQGEQPEMSKLWNLFAKEYEPSLKEAGENGGTVILDTESILWPIISGTWVNDPTGKKGALAWGPANARYRRVIGLARLHHANLVMIHQGTPIWEEDEDGKIKETGRLEPKAHKENLALVDVRIELMKPGVGAGPTDFRARVEHCGMNPRLEGMVWDVARKTPVGRNGLAIPVQFSYAQLAAQLGIEEKEK